MCSASFDHKAPSGVSLAHEQSVGKMDISSPTHFVKSSPAIGSSTIGFFRKRRWFILFVIMPTLFAAIYYSVIASDMYESEARFVIKSPAAKQPQVSSIANLIQSTGLSSGLEQTNEVLDYIKSRNALQDLDKEANVRALFTRPDIDWFSRYPMPLRQDRFENLFIYYGKMVSVRMDHDTNSAVLTVKAFTPQDARDLNQRLLGLSEALVNRLNSRAQAKAIGEAEAHVRDAQARVRNARLALRTYRNSQDVLNPTAEATGVLEVSNKLIAEQATLRAQLATMQQVAPQNPAIPALRSRIESIGTQIAAQKGRAVGTDSGLASKLTQYETLQVEQEFATQMFTLASATLEQARTEAVKQQYYLERVVEPDQPDIAMYPKRLLNILVVAGASMALYLIGWMLIVGILEHAPED
ncbi:Wzz/FepE/Etk N-terminal domain-containing protein [Novosphingobium sp. FKTRR1]|uniref:Wzz/FepE/Etk N-terminal domain-containing protein n=1 Tax=Novosphingobium sp. FKTRR1 TaxID=2879118 RepID=UPI001CF0C5F7|nr:Wzz/FepE/Etk N-terminal domain-containing protein [Novosphingobium sp. FKTRR1]